MSEAILIIPDEFGRGEITPRPEAFMGLRLSGQTMGTSWSASWCSAPGLPEDAVRAALEASFSAIIASMSPWEATSLISMFNSLSPGERLRVDAPFQEVMTLALQVARESGGVFDPCLGGEVMRRGFGPVGVGARLEGAAHGDNVWAALMPEEGVLMQPGGVTLDLNAVAKGFAVDVMGRVLEGFGITQYLVEIGGEFVGRGVKPDRSPWWVDLEAPSPGSALWRIALIGQAMATSGDYRQQRQEGRARVSHIVPASTRKCVYGDLASVTVIAASCALADAWATALFAMGDEDGMALAEQKGLAVLMQYRGAPPRYSSKLSGWLD
ncbi:FAD:protein FMN transferase [Hyphomonas sp. WL0036]|uniref:FAD:protein FMN transferase n=1 Tax=Hyphomonas sediminis TaxID=2866160 RepID=UPI001C8223F2|nr:FAD:protein FMN transferase [Hyphomonas sediminis]MBY9067503.1 FAD:protein FMN transferase [Hyphomonas sediminis]